MTNNTTMTIFNSTTIKSGRMQFNAKSAKNFRDTLAKWHDADFALAEKIMRKNESVQGYKVALATEQGLLAQVEAGEKGKFKTAEEYRATIADLQASIHALSADLQEFRETQKARYQSAHDLLTKGLYTAYVEYITDGNRDGYVSALAQFFTENGLEPAMDSINDFISAVGKKKATSAQKIKTGKHVGAMSYNAWRDIFLGEVCDVMADALPIYKFTYVLKKDRQNNK